MRGMDAALDVLGLVLVIGVVAAGARRVSYLEPLVLVVIGLGLSFVPHVLEVRLTPSLALVGLLPPLLYAAAIRTSLVRFRSNLEAILLLAVGAVAFCTFAVGLVLWWILPGAGLAAALALGAVVAPPDAVAATAIGRRVGMPRRIVATLASESLLNDAAALVALSTAVGAITGTVHPAGVAWALVREAGGGLLVGVIAAGVLSQIRRHLQDSVLDTTLSFAAPYVAFLPAQEIQASGVLAVVVCGLLLGHRAPVLQSAGSRIAEHINWSTVQFILENAVFLLIGLQVRTLAADVSAGGVPWSQVVPVCAVVLAATIAARFTYVFLVAAAVRLAGREAWSPAECTIVSWAGMRGVVTLAAVFVIPRHAPERPVLAFAAFTVVAGTLLLQGTTLPWLVRRLALPGPSVAEDALQLAALTTAATQAGLGRLAEVRSADDPADVIAQLKDRALRRANQVWERLGRSVDELEPPEVIYRRLRMQMLDAERAAILEARDRGVYDDEVLHTAMTAIDVEESTLERVEDATTRLGEELSTPPVRVGDCEHLRHAATVVAPTTPTGCAECLRDGTQWVHLRLCLTCGHVGCCDSSVGRHATAHFKDTGHPVMRSFEPGESWRWCYVDELLG